jgi:membrane associated rhomboid family serine protease
MFKRRTTGSVVCPGCGSLVGVNDEKCYTCGRANPGLWGFGPLLRQLGTDMGFVPLVIGGSTLLYLASLVLSGSDVQLVGGFSILSPSLDALRLIGASGAYAVFIEGQWWTLLSATWLHGGLLHILFNMMWVRDLGPSSAEIVGPARTVIIYTVSGVCGFLLSSVAGRFLPFSIPFFGVAPFSVGASASIFGLLGAMVHYGHKSGSSYIRTEATRYALILFVMGVLIRGVDNYAHAGGFLGGYATSWFFNPLTRERGDHTIVAVLMIAATALAVIASVIVGLPRYR